MFENISNSAKKRPNEYFQALSSDLENKSLENEAVTGLEETLFDNGYAIAGSIEAAEVLRSEKLFCRSEQFTKVLDLIVSEEPLVIENRNGRANMCTVSAGSGFRVAMLEGFSGKDVGGLVKVVVTFCGEHLTEHAPLAKDNELWQTKQETASVSLIGRGEVHKEDIEMVSFRFPVSHYPEHMLTEEEKDRLDEVGVQFVVRHYVPNKKAASSFVN